MTATVKVFRSCLNKPSVSGTGRVTACLFLAAALPAASSGADVSMDAFVGDRQPISTFVPKYPQEAVDKRLEGEVTVCFFIDDDGKVKRAKIRRSSHRVFEKPVLRAIRASAFEPLGEGRKASPAKTCRTFHFRLESIGEQSPVD